jgi:hypothetical protein
MFWQVRRLFMSELPTLKTRIIMKISMFHFSHGDFVNATASQVQFVFRRRYHVSHHAAA